VQIPHQDETVAVVSSGLSVGDTVVTDGASRLTDGAKVKRLDSK
jgi:multidrug efflux pump subunit AcrA (membrane-fusion protein)